MSTSSPEKRELQEALLGTLAFRPDDDEVAEWKTLNEILVEYDPWRSDDVVETDVAARIEAAVGVLEDAYAKGLLDKYEAISVRDTPMRITEAGETALSEWDIVPEDDSGFQSGMTVDSQGDDVLEVDSSTWTGLSKTIINARNAKHIGRLIDQALIRLPASGAGNYETMQAAAYLKAAKELVDAPEPPSELIWQLISKAADILGVAAFLYTIFAQAAR